MSNSGECNKSVTSSKTKSNKSSKIHWYQLCNQPFSSADLLAFTCVHPHANRFLKAKAITSSRVQGTISSSIFANSFARACFENKNVSTNTYSGVPYRRQMVVRAAMKTDSDIITNNIPVFPCKSLMLASAMSCIQW